METRRTGKAGVEDVASTEPSLDDLVVDIAHHLEVDGEYRTTVVARHPQRLVDLRWAALQAGRLVGCRVRVVTSRAESAWDKPVAVRMVCSGPATNRGVVPRMREEPDTSGS